MHYFNGDLLLELGVSSLGKVDLAHSAGAQRVQHPIGPNSISHHFPSMHPNKAGLQTVAGLAAGYCLRVCKQGLKAYLGDGNHAKRK